MTRSRTCIIKTGKFLKTHSTTSGQDEHSDDHIVDMVDRIPAFCMARHQAMGIDARPENTETATSQITRNGNREGIGFHREKSC